jgi:hypothetical protein
VVFGGPLGVLLVAAMVVVAVIAWLLQRRPRHPGPRLLDDDGIDREELEAAEREVRELETRQRPDEGFEGDDWGAGAAHPRRPVRR